MFVVISEEFAYWHSDQLVGQVPQIQENLTQTPVRNLREASWKGPWPPGDELPKGSMPVYGIY